MSDAPVRAVPPSWVVVQLDRIADVRLGKTPAKERYRDTGSHRIVKFRDIAAGRVDWTASARAFVDGSAGSTHDLVPVMAGDILATASAHASEHIGKKTAHVDFLPSGYDGVYVVGELLRVRCHRLTLDHAPRFVFYFLSSEMGYRAIQARVRGVHLIGREACRIEVPFAPLAEQHRIVDAVDQHLTRLDASVAALRRVQEKLKTYRASVLKAACEGRLVPTEAELARQEGRGYETAGEILARLGVPAQLRDVPYLPNLPEGWVAARVGDLGDVVTGSTPPTGNPAHYGGDIPFVTPTDLDAGYQVRLGRSGLTASGEARCRPVPPRSVLVTCIGATIGKTGLGRVRLATNQQVNAIVPAESAGVAAEWVFWVVCSRHGQEWIRANASATTLPILKKSRFEQLPVPLPPLAEQHRIVGEVERRFSVVEKLETVVETGLERAERLRQAILKRAFEGKLVPQDPNDEPASVLLERIRAERAAAGPNVRRVPAMRTSPGKRPRDRGSIRARPDGPR
ncbi:MAG: restriction endonuclease subunit S [Myxococcota bacterium]|nr:restriction endonuclease subunit S [Myxococcota bacterium]